LATLRAPNSGRRRGTDSRSDLEKSLEKGVMHDGTIKLPSNVDIQKAMADLELASNSPLPSYDDADKFMTLSNINFDVNAFQEAYEQQKQQEKPEVSSVEVQKRKPLPPPPAVNETSQVDIESLLPSTFADNSGRNRAQTDFGVPPSFLQQKPVSQEYQTYNVESTKIPTQGTPSRNTAQSCFDDKTIRNPASSRKRPSKTPVEIPLQSPSCAPSNIAGRPGKQLPDRGTPTKQLPKKPIPQNDASKNLAQCMKQAQQVQQTQQAEPVNNYRPVAARAASTPHTNTDFQQNSVPAYISGLTQNTNGQQSAKVETPAIPQKTVQQGYQPSYLSSDSYSQQQRQPQPQPQTQSYGSQERQYGQQTGSGVNLYTQQASVLPGTRPVNHPGLPVSASTPAVQRQQAPGPQPQNQSTPAEVPPDWEPKQTPDGRVFYLDHTEKKTHWAPPQGWAVRKTNDRRLYFVHHPTKSTHWKLPPPGWDVCRLPDDRLFFVDHINKKTSWTLPE